MALQTGNPQIISSAGTMNVTPEIIIATPPAPAAAMGNPIILMPPPNNFDDTLAIRQAIIAAAQFGPGVIIQMQAGNYQVCPKAIPSPYPTTPAAYNNPAFHNIYIDCPNVTLQGVANGGTTITCWSNAAAPGGGIGVRNDAVWGITSDNKVWRGSGVFCPGSSNSAAPFNGTTIRDIVFDGTDAYTGNNSFPANVATGDGWDLSQKGLNLNANQFFDNTLVERCTFRNFRGELIFGGGDIGHITTRKCVLHDTNGDGHSVSGIVTFQDNEVYNCANHGVEDIQPYTGAAVTFGASTYRRNYIHNCLLDGLDFKQATAVTTLQPATKIEDNLVHSCSRSGIYVIGLGTNVEVRRNTCIDCGTAANGRAFGFDYNGQAGIRLDTITVENNIVIVDQLAGFYGYQLVDPDGTHTRNFFLKRNKVMHTQNAVTNSLSVTPLKLSAVAASAALNEEGSDFIATASSRTDLSVVTDLLIVPTTLTTIASLFWPQTRNVEVVGSFRIPGASNVTVLFQFFYQDPSGTNHTVVWQASTSLAPGVYVYPANLVAILGGGNAFGSGVTVGVQITCGTASVVLASAAIRRI